MIQKTQCQALGNCESFQNLAALSKKLQTQNFHAYQPSQPPSIQIHQYKEFELPSGPIDLRIIQIVFLIFFRGVSMKKNNFKLKIPRFFIGYILY